MDSGSDFINGTGRYGTIGGIFSTGPDGKVQHSRVSVGRDGKLRQLENLSTGRDDGTSLTTGLPSLPAVTRYRRSRPVMISLEIKNAIFLRATEGLTRPPSPGFQMTLIFRYFFRYGWLRRFLDPRCIRVFARCLPLLRIIQ